MRDSREKGAGMRDQDPPFQTLFILARYAVTIFILSAIDHFCLAQIPWLKFGSSLAESKARARGRKFPRIFGNTSSQ